MAKKKATKKKTTAKTAGRATKKTTRKAATKKSANKEMLLVGSKVKAALKDHNLNVAGDALEGLNEWMYLLIEQAASRAAQNGRKTVRSHDFMAN